MKKLSLTEETTFVIVKPDGVRRGLTGEIIRRIEQRGLKVVALEMVWASRSEMDKHYPKDKAWITNLGGNTLRTYEEFKIPVNIKKEYGTNDPYKIGLMVRNWLIDFMISGPVVKIGIQGVHAIKMIRKIVGPTIPAFAEMGTIRGDYSIDSPALANAARRAVRNIVHASGNPAEAENELRMWFKERQIHKYQRSEEDAMF